MVVVEDVEDAALAVFPHAGRVDAARRDGAVVEAVVMIRYEPVSLLVVIAKEVLTAVRMAEKTQDVLVTDTPEIGTRSLVLAGSKRRFIVCDEIPQVLPSNQILRRPHVHLGPPRIR